LAKERQILMKNIFAYAYLGSLLAMCFAGIFLIKPFTKASDILGSVTVLAVIVGLVMLVVSEKSHEIRDKKSLRKSQKVYDRFNKV
jgi:cadmium resistance protein CadD (predicted permease)